MATYSNIIEKPILRKVQKDTLAEIRKSLMNSFGPMGSNTIINKQKSLTMYTKDGHTIMSNLAFRRPIEESIVKDMVDQTHHVVKEYGDGTTSAVILSDIIFNGISDLESSGKYIPSDIIAAFNKVVARMTEIIKDNGRECTLDDIYKIALVSTNNDPELAAIIENIYKHYGLDVFIDVSASVDENDNIKQYDGMTLNTGYDETAFINTAKGSSRIRNPEIYVFKDPIDTPEMAGFLDKILQNNIFEPMAETQAYRKGAKLSTKDGLPRQVVPTVILAPKLSRDMSVYIDNLISMLDRMDRNNKIPILMVTNIHQMDQLEDIAKMCGTRAIQKFIDPDLQQQYIERGIAPTLDTVKEFCGTAEVVESTVNKTMFIDPSQMYDENGNYSDIFNNLVQTLEDELKKAKEEGLDYNVTGTLKRRINSLKANMVEVFIGGVSVSDRDSKRALVEDAVLACRSAAKNGVGYGANYEALQAAYMLCKGHTYEPKDTELLEDGLTQAIANMILSAYKEVSEVLYNTAFSHEIAQNTVMESLKFINVGPMNLRTGEFDKTVLASIDADVIVLNTISKIITLMATSNQFLVENPLENQLYDTERD